MSGGYQDSTDRRTYCRVLKSVDLAQDGQQQRILSLIGEAVFKNLAMRVTVDKEPEPDTITANFVSKMREIHSLHFTPTTPLDAMAGVKA